MQGKLKNLAITSSRAANSKKDDADNSNRDIDGRMFTPLQFIRSAALGMIVAAVMISVGQYGTFSIEKDTAARRWLDA